MAATKTRDTEPTSLTIGGKRWVFLPPDDRYENEDEVEGGPMVSMRDLVDFAAANRDAFDRFRKARSKWWS